MRAFVPFLLLSAGAALACGGATTHDSPSDAGPLDAAVTADASAPDAASATDASPADAPYDAWVYTCGDPLPTVAIYNCAPLPPGSKGCPAAYGDPSTSNTNVYPEGCVMYEPRPQGGCVGNCCGPQECICQTFAGTSSAPSFVCPM